MLVCLVSIEAKTGMRDTLTGLIERCALASRKEAGCISYELFISEDNDCKAVLKESWQDNAALLEHFRTEHYNELMEHSQGMREKPDNVQIFEMDERRLQAVADDTSSLVEVISAIQSRRCIRRFTSEPVSPEALNTILQAGFSAPSALNKRPYNFVVVDDKSMLAELSMLNPHWRPLRNAQVCIVVCGDQAIQNVPEFLYEDCAATAQNMLLCIHGLHLGGVWCGISTVTPGFNEIAEKLRMPSTVIPVSIIAIGHPDEERAAPNRYEAAKVFSNGF